MKHQCAAGCAICAARPGWLRRRCQNISAYLKQPTPSTRQARETYRRRRSQSWRVFSTPPRITSWDLATKDKRRLCKPPFFLICLVQRVNPLRQHVVFTGVAIRREHGVEQPPAVAGVDHGLRLAVDVYGLDLGVGYRAEVKDVVITAPGVFSRRVVLRRFGWILVRYSRGRCNA